MPVIPYQIVRLAKGGQGISYYNEKVFFVDGALPGECGQAEVISEKARFGVCRAVSFDTRSPSRVLHDNCPISGMCDGCGFRHVNADMAFKLKSEALCCEIFKIAHLDPIAPDYYSVMGPDGSLDGLRQRMRLHLADGKIGYFAHNSHRIVPAGQCVVIHPALRSVAERLEAIQLPALHFACDLQIDLDDALKPFLHIRPIQNERSRAKTVKLTKPAVWLRQIVNAGIFGGIRFGEEQIAGDEMIRDIVHISGAPDVIYWRRVGDFAQATKQGNAVLHRLVANFLDQTKPHAVADLFAGSGNLTFRAAQCAPVVHAFEFFCDPAAFRRGCEDNRSFWPDGTSVDLQMCDLTKGLPADASICDAAICDPAREGLSEKMCYDLKKSGIQHILYISCEATNFARDLARLSHSFRLESIGFVDMFPQTAHVETVAVLTRRASSD